MANASRRDTNCENTWVLTTRQVDIGYIMFVTVNGLILGYYSYPLLMPIETCLSPLSLLIESQTLACLLNCCISPVTCFETTPHWP